MRGILGCEKKRTHIPIPECVDSFVEGAKEFQEKEEHPRRCSAFRIVRFTADRFFFLNMCRLNSAYCQDQIGSVVSDAMIIKE